MEVINIRKQNLNNLGYNNLIDLLKKPNHIYIGRNLSYYVEGENGSKWKNPYNLNLYEKHIRNN